MLQDESERVLSADKAVSDVERYMGRPDAFASLDIADYFGRTAHMTVAQHDKGRPIPQHAQGRVFRDNCETNPWLVWEKEQPSIARVMPIPKINTEDFWLRQLLTQPGMAPRSLEELLTVDGIGYPTCTAAASAMGLMRNEKVARRVLDEECYDTLTTPSTMRFLLAVLVRNLEKSGYLLNLVQDYLPHLSEPDWPEEDRLRLVLTVRYCSGLHACRTDRPSDGTIAAPWLLLSCFHCLPTYPQAVNTSHVREQSARPYIYI